MLGEVGSETIALSQHTSGIYLRRVFEIRQWPRSSWHQREG